MTKPAIRNESGGLTARIPNVYSRTLHFGSRTYIDFAGISLGVGAVERNNTLVAFLFVIRSLEKGAGFLGLIDV